MFLQASVNSARPTFSPPAGRPRLLLVGDSRERLARLRVALSGCGVEIMCADVTADLRRDCRGGCDLAAVDVGPAHLAPVLEALRAGAACREIPLLVRADRLAGERALSGLLPRYRAMPCGEAEIVRLVRHLTTPGYSRREGPRVL
jgi:hypothetical protein